jgi:glycosyltransferase involved in cell wall biosynthesis
VNVGLVIYGSLDSPSGGYRYDRELLRHLELRGASVAVYSQAWRAYPFRLAENLRRSFRRRIEDANLDVLLEDELNHPSLLSMKRGRSLPARVSIVHHLRSSEKHHPVANALYAKVEREYLDSVDAFICNSDTTASVVRRMSPRARPLVVAKPAGRELPHPPTPEEILSKVSRRPLCIVFVGQLTHRKGLLTLLDAVARLPHRSWRLEVVGDPKAEPRYAHRCQTRARAFGSAVRFHGHLDGRRLDAIYRHAHILCVPSQYEGYGIVYAEAHQYGLPVVASQAGAAHEIVEHEKTGFLVPVDSAAAVAAALEKLSDDRRLASFSIRAVKRARLFPTWEQSMERAVDFLEGVAALPRKPRGGRE